MPRIIGSTLADHRKKTREQLFSALSRLMQNNSFENLTMAKIATEAGVGRTAVYNHFNDKEALLLAYIDYETQQYAIRLKRSLEGVQDPIKQLRIYIREQLMLGNKCRLAPRTNLHQQVSSQTSKELHSHAHVVENILRVILRNAIYRKIIPPQNLSILTNMINACLSSQILPADPGPREYVIRSIQCFVLRGLGVTHNHAPIPLSRQFLDRQIDMEESPYASANIAHTTGAHCPVHS